jgi:hypothetical protein
VSTSVTLPIKREDHNLDDISAELERRLRAFNEAAAGPLRRTPVALTIRDETTALIGAAPKRAWTHAREGGGVGLRFGL